MAFRTVVNTIAARNGLWADFSPKPLEDQPGNGMHINFSVPHAGEATMAQVIAGILRHIPELTVFLNTTDSSYRRFGSHKAPRYVSWSRENRSQLIRIPAATGEYRRAELRSPDPLCNPYLAFALLIRAGLDGVRQQLTLPPAADVNLYTASADTAAGFRTLPGSLAQAKNEARSSAFIAACLPETVIGYYTK